MMFWLVVGYLFLFIFRPYEYWPILGTLHIERIYMIFLLVAVMTWKDKRYIPHPINSSVLTFVSAMLISALFALSWTDAYARLYTYMTLIIFYFIIILTIRDEEDLKKFIIAYIVIMLLYVGKSSWEFFINDRHEWRMGVRRMVGIDTTYGDANAFGASIAYSLPFLWALIKTKIENPKIRKMLWTYAAIALSCIIFTGSRSSMVTMLLFFILTWLGTSKKLLVAIIMLLSLIIAWHGMPDMYQQRFLTIFKPEINTEQSAQGRILTLKEGVAMFKSNPILGVGPGNFSRGSAQLISSSGLSSHNLYGSLLGEMGLIGVFSFSFLVITIVATHWSIIKRLKKINLPGSGFLTSVSIASIHTIIMLLFNGNFGANLYRYNWLWIGAIGVLSSYFIEQKKDCYRQKLTDV